MHCSTASCLHLVTSGQGLAHRPEPVWRGDRLAAVRLGGADVRGNRPAAGQQQGSPSRGQRGVPGREGGEQSIALWLIPCVSDSNAGRAGVPLHHQRGDGAAQPESELPDTAGLCRPLHRRRRLQAHRLPQAGGLCCSVSLTPAKNESE